MGESIARTYIPTSGTQHTGQHLALPEYVIYTFRKDAEASRSSDLWQYMGASTDIVQAREKALTLFRSSRYSRIELRKKFIDEKNGAVMDVPVEIFGRRPNLEMRNILILLGLAMGCAMMALALSVLV